MNKEYMQLADEQARINLQNHSQDGGPFGAVIVKDGQVIAKAHNQVLKNNDPTAHAEVMAIRLACEKLHTHDLSGCALYTSCEPCPMCLSASIWANIKEIYYGNTRKDADKIGFRDDFIYQAFENKAETNFKKIPLGREITIDTFEEFQKMQDKKIY